VPFKFLRASDYQLAWRATSIALVFLAAFMSLAMAIAQLTLPASAPLSRKSAPSRGILWSADGQRLAMGPLNKRVYPYGTLAAQVIGFVGAEGGLEGLEEVYDERLQRGEDVTVTLHSSIQASVEKVLQDAVDRTDAEFGSVVVLETQTGKIRAMASVPGFDANAWKKTSPSKWRNRAALDEYEPGSVIKALTVAALLNEGRTTPERTYDTPMWRRYAGTTINDIVQHPAKLTTREILRYSSNVGMTRLVEDVSAEVLYRYFTAFGFGQPVDLGLPAADGLLRDEEDWGALTQATMSFGQGMTVTTVQLAAAFNVVANEGRYVAPRLVADAPASFQQVLSQRTSAAMRDILHSVIDDGIKTRAELPGYHVGGKTGTAQVVVDGRYSPEVFSSTFAGFTSANEPWFTVAVMVRGAKRDFQGSQLAAPIFRDITSALMSLYAIVPEPDPAREEP